MKALSILFLCAGSLLAQLTPQVLDTGKVGPNIGADGVQQALRLSRDASLVNTEAHGRYQEAVSRGNVFTATTIQATAAAANVSPLGAAGTPLVGIFNPANSGRNFVVLQAIVCEVSTATAPVNPVFIWNVVAAPAGVTAAGTNGINNLTFTANSSARVFANAVTTGSLAASALRPIGGLTAGVMTAATTAAVNACSSEETAGQIIVPPGAFLGIGIGAAGTTTLVSVSMTWEEVPAP